MTFDLPQHLQTFIEEELKNFNSKSLIAAAEELSSNYRNRINVQKYFSSDLFRAAYLATRLPATYAAVCAVLNETKSLLPELEIKSLSDIGAGVGTASFAAAEFFENLERITLIEKDAQMISLGQKLMRDVFDSAKFVRQNINDNISFEPHDLVIISYALNEIESKTNLVERAWQACDKLLIIIEPGSRAGFENILQARSHLLKQEANLIAPCPHSNACPLTQNDWCHFSVRLSRTILHRKTKAATLSYEDEKFSYIVFSKVGDVSRRARILRHPVKHKGHVQLTLCTNEGYKTEIVSARNKEDYKRARKADWGDGWEKL